MKVQSKKRIIATQGCGTLTIALIYFKEEKVMARTSRKNFTKRVTTAKIHCAAGYVRLSVVKSGQQQDSIENQKRMIEDFISGK